MNKYQNLVISKSGKSDFLNCKVWSWKFEVENLHQNLELIKNGPHLSCNLHKIRANIHINLAVAPFSCKKVWSWVDGWMDG